MTLTQEQINSLIEYLQGSCNMLSEAIDTLFECDEMDIENSNEMYDDIDNHIFLCTCGWWCCISERNESNNMEDICDDCLEMENQD